MMQIIKEIQKSVNYATKCGSNNLSAWIRFVVEKRQFRNAFGSQIVAMSVVFGVLTLPIHAFDYSSTRPQFVDGTAFVPVTTETTYLFPVVRPLGISQGYGRFHPAVDIRAPRGSEIVAMATGVVISSTYTPSGYGKHIRILHEGNVISLYAHLDTTLVNAGDKVTKGQEIGTIGMTGWTTGPHLHFEVSQDAKYVDPLSVVR